MAVNETQEVVDMIDKYWDINKGGVKPNIAKVIDHKKIDISTSDWVVVYYVSYNPQVKGDFQHDHWTKENIQAIDIRTSGGHDRLMELRDETMRTLYENRKCPDIDGYDRLDVNPGPGDLSDKMRRMFRWVLHVRMTGYFKAIET